MFSISLSRSHSHFPLAQNLSNQTNAAAVAMAAIARLRTAALGLRPNRGFGSAAAVQCYYDDDDYDEEEEMEEERAPRGALDAQGCAPENGVQWVMIGEPGAKRHQFAQRLSKLLEVPHISMATLLSQDLNPRSSLYQQVN